MKIDKTKIVLALSLLLNVLGGASLVPPVVGAPTPPPCAVCPICPSH